MSYARFQPVIGQPDVYECRAFDWDSPRQITKDAEGLPAGWVVIRCDEPRLGKHARIVDGRPQWL